MINIYFDDGVQCMCVHTCSNIKEAVQWINHELKGHTMVDDNHPCTDDIMASTRTAKYMVFDGAPITIGAYGIPYLSEPIYESDYFYTK